MTPVADFLLLQLPKLLLGVFLLVPGTSQIGSKEHPSEETSFSMEFPFKQPVALNEAARRTLAADKSIADVMKDERLSIETIPEDWFQASEVHLGPRGETDLVVMGKGVPTGRYSAAFWILRPTPKGYEIVLAIHTHDLTLLKNKTHGLRDIAVGESYAAAGERLSTGGGRDSDTYKFDGQHYQRVLRSDKPV